MGLDIKAGTLAILDLYKIGADNGMLDAVIGADKKAGFIQKCNELVEKINANAIKPEDAADYVLVLKKEIKDLAGGPEALKNIFKDINFKEMIGKDVEDLPAEQTPGNLKKDFSAVVGNFLDLDEDTINSYVTPITNMLGSGTDLAVSGYKRAPQWLKAIGLLFGAYTIFKGGLTPGGIMGSVFQLAMGAAVIGILCAAFLPKEQGLAAEAEKDKDKHGVNPVHPNRVPKQESEEVTRPNWDLATVR